MSTSEVPGPAEIAHAVSECMNLLFLFAAPRVLDSMRRTGMGGVDGPAALGALRRFLRQASGICARAERASGRTEDVDRLVNAAILVEEIAGSLDVSRLQEPLPAGVVDRARRALAIVGVPPPEGGWDAFEGFALPYPAPSPSPPR